jgi:enoyl-CoA hydratase
MSNPDFQYPPWLMGMRGALEFMLTGNAMDGKKAVRVGYANDVFPREELEEKVLEIAEQVAKIPPDLQMLNKRTVHQAYEIMGIRSAINAGVYLHSMGFLSKSSEKYMAQIAEDLNKAMKSKYSEFGDYETKKNNQ